jgi:hypothetical protein
MSAADSANLFSRLRNRRGITSAINNSDNQVDTISRSIGHNANTAASTAEALREGVYPSTHAIAPAAGISRAAQELSEAGIASSATNAAIETTSASSSDMEKTRRHRSRSRPRESHRSKSRSRHRSKSQGRDKDGKQYKEKMEEKQSALSSSSSGAMATTSFDAATATTAGGIGGTESLRDYWKRRAEESKERVSATSNNNSLEDNSLEQRRISRSPREERIFKLSSSSRQVDSIASALTSHAPLSPSRQRQVVTVTSDSNNSLSPLHRSLEKASWKELHQHIIDLSKSSNLTEIAAQLSVPHPRDGGTTLHISSWKAPPSLGAMMIQLMPENSREMAVLQSIRDGEGNTPLHLCCGNLEYNEDGIDYLAVLKAIVKVAPKSAWSMQNSEGDTPLHMLVTSPLCTGTAAADDDDTTRGASKNRTSSSGVSTTSKSTKTEKLALEAVNLVLKAEAFECATIPERTGATPLHVALANGSHDCVIEALLDAAPSAAEVEDGRGLLPLHWAAAFARVGYGVVKRLINAYPQAVTHASIDGDIPLHLAVANATIDKVDDGRGGSSASIDVNKVDRNRLKIVELLMNDAVWKSSPLRDTSDLTSPILTANREKLTPLHVSYILK